MKNSYLCGFRLLTSTLFKDIIKKCVNKFKGNVSLKVIKIFIYKVLLFVIIPKIEPVIPCLPALEVFNRGIWNPDKKELDTCSLLAARRDKLCRYDIFMLHCEPWVRVDSSEGEFIRYLLVLSCLLNGSQIRFCEAKFC